MLRLPTLICAVLVVFMHSNANCDSGLDRVIERANELKEQGDFDVCSKILIHALDSLEKNDGTYEERSKVLIILAEASRSTMSYDMAFDYGHRAKRMAIKANNNLLLGWAYNRLGAIFYENWKSDSSLFYIDKSLESLDDLPKIPKEFEWLISSNTIIKAAILRQRDGHEKGRSLLYGLINKINKGELESDDLTLAYFNLSLMHADKGAIDSAISLAGYGYRIAVRDSSYTMIRQLAERLKDYFLEINEYDSAMHYLDRIYKTDEIIFSREKVKKLQLELSKYEFQSKQKANELLSSDLKAEKSQKFLYLFISVFTLLLSLVALYYFRKARQTNKRLNQQKELIEKQKEELQVLDQAKSRFFSNVSHELKTPLSLILGPLNEIQNKKRLEQGEEHYLNLALGNTKRLQELVNEILELTKIDAKKVENTPQPLYLKKFVYRLFDSFKTIATEKDQKLVIKENIDDDLCIKIDRDKYEKIISNLLSNAIKYSGDGTEIAVEINFNIKSRVLTSCVQDNGKGLSKEDQEKIFDRFYQGKLKAKEGGLGIGLALSKEYAKLMGGDLNFESEPFSKTLFQLSIPSEVVENEIDDTSFLFNEDASILDRIEKQSGAHVLLVEDNHEMRAFIKSIVSPYFKVHEAANGKKALDFLENNGVDMILSDIMMPEIDGLELFEKVRSNPNQRHIPFIIISAKGDDLTRVSALQDGVDDYIQKPFLASELLARVLNILQNRSERKTLDQVDSVENYDLSVSFVIKARKVIEKNINSPFFGVPELADELAQSERSLYRKIKMTTGLTPNNFIKEVKLKKAYSILEQRGGQSVSEVADLVGFKSRTTFSTQFTKRFGVSPSYYLQKN